MNENLCAYDMPMAVRQILDIPNYRQCGQIKSNFSKSCPQSIYSRFYSIVMSVKLAQKVTKYLGFFWGKFCIQIWSH